MRVGLRDARPRCRAHERDSLERLCRYIARPAVSNERLSVNGRGQVVYRLKHSFHDGTTAGMQEVGRSRCQSRGGKHAVESDEVTARTRHLGRQSREEVERLKQAAPGILPPAAFVPPCTAELAGAVAKRPLESVHDQAGSPGRPPLSEREGISG